VIEARMRLLTLLTMLLLLTGCIDNAVRSKTPWFSAADEAGAPALRSGVWNATDDPKCRFDERRPLERWPECAYGFVVRPNETLMLSPGTIQPNGDAAPGYTWLSEPTVLARGEPRIEQTQCDVFGKNLGSIDPQAQAESEAEGRFAYCYAAVRPDKLDPAGHIVAVTGWTVRCGPWNQDSKADSSITPAPFAGLTLVGRNCTAASIDALRAAAVRSEALVGAPHPGLQHAHWVRDGYR
jgi:hypothetical protein